MFSLNSNFVAHKLFLTTSFPTSHQAENRAQVAEGEVKKLQIENDKLDGNFAAELQIS